MPENNMTSVPFEPLAGERVGWGVTELRTHEQGLVGV